MAETHADNRRFEFRWDARRLTWLALLIAVIGAGGLALLFTDNDWDVKLLGGLWFAAFAYGAAALLRRRTITTPVVIVSADGIVDTRILDAPIPWNAIGHIEAFEAEHVPFIGLHFKDVAAALANAKPSVRAIARVQRRIGFPPVSINMTPLDGGNEDLVAAISAFRPHLLIPE